MRASILFACAALLVDLASCDRGPAGSAAPAPAPPASQPAVAASSAPVPAAPAPSASAAQAAAEPVFITAQHILVQYRGSANADPKISRTKQEARKRAQEAADKAKAGVDFSELVAQYSDDPGSAARQGNLGKFTRTQMVRPFSDAAFALPVSGISDVVETKFGFHVIKRNQ